jgi:hypothetical protein
MADLTIEVLKEIRDEVRATKVELAQTKEQLTGQIAQTNERLDQTNERLERLERRQVETEVRLATELTSVVGAIRDLKDAVVADRELRRDVADHEQRIRQLEAKRA